MSGAGFSPQTVANWREQLDDIPEPCGVGFGIGAGLVELGVIRNVAICDEYLTVELAVPCPACLSVGVMVEQIEASARRTFGDELRLDISFVDPFEWSWEGVKSASKTAPVVGGDSR